MACVWFRNVQLLEKAVCAFQGIMVSININCCIDEHLMYSALFKPSEWQDFDFILFSKPGLCPSRGYDCLPRDVGRVLRAQERCQTSNVVGNTESERKMQNCNEGLLNSPEEGN